MLKTFHLVIIIVLSHIFSSSFRIILKRSVFHPYAFILKNNFLTLKIEKRKKLFFCHFREAANFKLFIAISGA